MSIKGDQYIFLAVNRLAVDSPGVYVPGLNVNLSKTSDAEKPFITTYKYQTCRKAKSVIY